MLDQNGATENVPRDGFELQNTWQDKKLKKKQQANMKLWNYKKEQQQQQKEGFNKAVFWEPNM